MFPFFNKSEPLTDIEKSIPRRELVKQVLGTFSSMKFNLEDNFSEILPQNHLFVVQCINEDIATATKILKIVNILKQRRIKSVIWKMNGDKDGKIRVKYEYGKFFFEFPWDYSKYTTVEYTLEQFIRKQKNNIKMSNESKMFLDQRIDLNKSEVNLLVLPKN
jgi:hypothetical protein